MGFILPRWGRALEFIRVVCDLNSPAREVCMLDIIFVVAGFAFFFAAVLYTVACDRL